MEKETAKQIINTLLETHHIDSLSVVDISGVDMPENAISVNMQLVGVDREEIDTSTLDSEFKTL